MDKVDISEFSLDQKVNYYSGQIEKQFELLSGMAKSMKKMAIENQKLAASCFASQMLINLLLVNNSNK